jgi:amino acid transporter
MPASNRPRRRLLIATLTLSAVYAVYFVTASPLLHGSDHQRLHWWQWPFIAHDLLAALGMQPFYPHVGDAVGAGRFQIALIGLVASLPASLAYVLLIIWADRKLRSIGQSGSPIRHGR